MSAPDYVRRLEAVAAVAQAMVEACAEDLESDKPIPEGEALAYLEHLYYDFKYVLKVFSVEERQNFGEAVNETL